MRPLPWMDDAACIGKAKTFDSDNDARAKKICLRCNVREECLRYLASTPTLWRFGPVYGGLTSEERKKFQHRMNEPIDIERALRFMESKNVEAPLAGTKAGEQGRGSVPLDGAATAAPPAASTPRKPRRMWYDDPPALSPIEQAVADGRLKVIA